jgi:hypothetical protein
MRASLLALAAATVLAAAAPAPMASAQGVAIEAPGVGVRVGEPGYRRHYGERYGERRIYRDRVTVGGEGCRSVTVRKRLPDGSVVVRKRSSC